MKWHRVRGGLRLPARRGHELFCPWLSDGKRVDLFGRTSSRLKESDGLIRIKKVELEKGMQKGSPEGRKDFAQRRSKKKGQGKASMY